MRVSTYTPSLLAPEDLEALFVQRHQLAAQLVERVRDSVLTQSKYYSLLYGPRGIGKTHLISLVYHRVVAEKKLRENLAIAWLREEEWGVGCFFDLVDRILRALQKEYPGADLTGKIDALYQTSPSEAEAGAVRILLDFLGDRTLLLLMENLDELFQGLGTQGQKKLRSFLQEEGCCTIIATSQSLFDQVRLQTEPFYGFFNRRELKDFSVADAISLLTKIAELEDNRDLVQLLSSPLGRSRVQAVHHLAGGNPRIYVVFSHFLTRKSLDELIDSFLQMLDDLAPYYQARMQWLSPQQRKIIEVLCRFKYPRPVKEIAQWCFATQQTTASQLKELRDKGYVRSEKAGRQSFYELCEPLMRICLSVKEERGQAIKVIVAFLKSWFTPRELGVLLQSWSESVEHEFDPRIEEWHIQADSLYYLSRFEEAIASFDKALGLKPDDYAAWYNRGIALGQLGRFEEAIASYDKVIEIAPNFSGAKMNRAQLVFSLNVSEPDLRALESEIQALTPEALEGGWHFGVGIHAIFQRYHQASQWKQWLHRILETFEKHNYLKAITQGLTHQCKKLVSDMVSQAAAESWRDVWQEIGGHKPEFQIPLRLLNATLEYKKAPNDPKVFLALPIEERKILKQLLGLKGDE